MTFQGGPAILGSFVDIDDRKRAEDALRESEDRFRGAFANTGIGMCLVAPDGRFLQVNASMCDMLGYTQQELLAYTFQEVTHPKDRSKSQDLSHRMALDEVRFSQLEMRYLPNGGNIIWTILTITLIRPMPAGAEILHHRGPGHHRPEEAEELLRKAHEELERRVAGAHLRVGAGEHLLQDEIAERKRAENALRLSSKEPRQSPAGPSSGPWSAIWRWP